MHGFVLAVLHDCCRDRIKALITSTFILWTAQGFVNIFMREPDPSLRYKEIPVMTVKASPRGGGLGGGKGGDGSGAGQTPKAAKAKKK